jgi:GTP-binding protein Era
VNGGTTAGPDAFRCGHVAVVGRPNVGKSTLVNRLIGEKLSITSSRPQTTRHRILGVRTTERAQLLYVDTPGIHARRNRALNRYMNRAAVGALVGVDAVAMVVAALDWQAEDDVVLARVREQEAPVVLVINKVDTVADKAQLLPFLAESAARADCFADIVPVSARRGTNVERLEALLVDCLPLGPAVFPPEQFTDRSERFLASEILREKLIRRLGQEVPHRLSVEIESFDPRGAVTRIGAVIWVESKGQKAIVIGRRGEMLKRVGMEARSDLEKLLGRNVFLETWVKVRADWSDDERLLTRFGYQE